MQVKAITKKSENISDWYNDVIQFAKLAEHGPSKGTMILRPYGYNIWDAIVRILDQKIKGMGVDNAYFPLFIPYSFLQKEKTHVEGFSPELAVVTHGGGEKLTEPLVVRPTSETIMYDAFSRWIQSFRDLPFKINQWSNVVRWEKRPYMFIRGTEFLWQEGHTAHATEKDAQDMVAQALNEYVDTYQSHLALFGYAGRKSESEKFAGADETFTYEILTPDGKVIQSATSHNLGQNFAKAFNVQFQDEKGKRKYVYQTSWGFSTRSLGPLILVHGDDNGLVLPPAIAPIQVIIIPIKKSTTNSQEVANLTNEVFTRLEEHDIRVKVDDSDQTPGWKFNEYELAGVPLRIEIGSAEAEKQEVKVIRRDNKAEHFLKVGEVSSEVEKLLKQIQSDLFNKSKEFTQNNTFEVNSYPEFKNIMNTTRGFIKAFWCEDKDCEAKIKEETKASTRCLPLDAPEEKGECVYCQKSATHRWLFAQAY